MPPAMSFVFVPPPVPSVPVHGSAQRFAVHRIYCVGRNYEDHADRKSTRLNSSH